MAGMVRLTGVAGRNQPSRGVDRRGDPVLLFQSLNRVQQFFDDWVTMVMTFSSLLVDVNYSGGHQGRKMSMMAFDFNGVSIFSRAFCTRFKQHVQIGRIRGVGGQLIQKISAGRIGQDSQRDVDVGGHGITTVPI